MNVSPRPLALALLTCLALTLAGVAGRAHADAAPDAALPLKSAPPARPPVKPAAAATTPASGSAKPAATTPSGRDLLHASVDAAGGKALFSKLRNIRMKGTLSIAAQGMTGPLTVWQAVPDKVLTVIELPGLGKMQEGYDGKTGWALDPLQGPRILSGDEVAQLRDQGADILSAADVDAAFPGADLVGRTTFDGHDAWEVALKTRQGQVIHAFFDAASHLQVGMKTEMSSPMGKMTVSTAMSDYKTFSGVKLPTKMTQAIMGMDTVVTIDTVDFDVTDLPSFSPPKEVLEQASEGAAAVPGTEE